ncbi:hypothetical protein [Cesiribacter andamanensis]|uniref:Uncharacterized protein n=1 Tax=Cesiribacter andamanensis AMV16 TaxID=1279009 RepID=M7NA66_9BACT|nr:hypothetical protein [Cesiribacter andamanensis]EMR04096.1 hypothetical protein ADICEAN_00719 [Cesiribacter andamanensis AMV16]
MLLALPLSLYAQKPAASLEQVRNGGATSPVSPGNWQNGNLNASQAHFVESHSIPYRALLTGLPSNTEVSLTMAYDIRHSSRNALDFLTHFDRIQPHGQFFHNQEIIDPTIGTSFAGQLASPTSKLVIPRPTLLRTDGVPGTVWDQLTADKREMSMWGGEILSIVYDGSGDLSVSNSEQRIIVTFKTGTSGSAVLAWGGHIASRLDWGYDNAGVPLSAGGISGSPYHMRLKSWTLGNLGNQDRSLAAAAVIPPPSCDIEGPASVCAGASSIYSTDEVADSYMWTLVNNTNGAVFNPAPSSTSQSVTVVANATMGGSYTVKLVTVRNGISSTEPCEFPVTVIYPTTNEIANRIHCHGDPGAAINFSSPVEGATFSWTSSANVGFGSSGIGNIGAYTASNTTNAPIVATVTVIASANGCAGPARTFTVTVNPRPATNFRYV